jgi:hypothetical protein
LYILHILQDYYYNFTLLHVYTTLKRNKILYTIHVYYIQYYTLATKLEPIRIQLTNPKIPLSNPSKKESGNLKKFKLQFLSILVNILNSKIKKIIIIVVVPALKEEIFFLIIINKILII